LIHDLLVERRGVDPAAETCWRALTELLDHPVSKVEHGTLWRFDLPDSAPEFIAAARDRIEAAASRAGRYVNLNRDRMFWLDRPRPRPAVADPGGFAVDVWIQDGEGADGEALAYFRRAEPRLVSLRCGIVWRVWLDVETERDARALADEITVTRARRHGLLMNPHAQRSTILSVAGAGKGPA